MSTEMIGKQIATMRKERGIKQEELANYVMVSPQAVSKWENGGVPDIELLPKIAEFFSVSIDYLFGRTITDYTDLKTALTKKLMDTPTDKKIKETLEYCWIMEKAIMPYAKSNNTGDLAEYENDLGKDDQMYSSMLTDNGFTHMGIANRLQYFLVVPDPENCEKAYFDNVDYTGLFKELSDKDVFNAFVMLNKRDYKKGFTKNLFVKSLGVSLDKANEIISILLKYHLVNSTEVELDDEVQIIYRFSPTPSFPALLIFAREIIEKPNHFAYYCENRKTPYFK